MASAPPESGDLVSIVMAGDRRASLEAIRDQLAQTMQDDVPAYVVAQVAGRLQSVLKEISELPAAKKVSKADELANRRKARIAAADQAAPAVGGDGN